MTLTPINVVQGHTLFVTETHDYTYDTVRPVQDDDFAHCLIQNTDYVLYQQGYTSSAAGELYDSTAFTLNVDVAQSTQTLSVHPPRNYYVKNDNCDLLVVGTMSCQIDLYIEVSSFNGTLSKVIDF